VGLMVDLEPVASPTWFVIKWNESRGWPTTVSVVGLCKGIAEWIQLDCM
jgi:hypothetical protein